MCSGGPSCLSYMCTMLLEKKPRSVLDVGIGSGKWGFLVREYVDIWRPGNKYGKADIDQTSFDDSDRFNCERFYGKDRTRLVGIEIYEPYVMDIQRMIYDEILIGNVYDLLPKMKEHFEVIIAADVVEHLKKEQGIELLKEFKKHGKVTYVLIPINCGRSDVGEHGNDYEIHRSDWDYEELREFGTTYVIGDVYNVLEIEGNKGIKDILHELKNKLKNLVIKSIWFLPYLFVRTTSTWIYKGPMWFRKPFRIVFNSIDKFERSLLILLNRRN